MKKNNQKGFMLVETLVVTTFIAGVFIFLFIQFNTLNKSYKNSFKYDSVEGIYALEDIVNYLNTDNNIKTKITTNLMDNNYIKISNCSSMIVSDIDYCDELFDLEEIKEAIIIEQNYKLSENDNVSENIKEYLNKVNKRNTNNLNYFIIAELTNGNIVSKYVDF